MLPDSSKSLVSCCGYNMGMIKWTGNDLLTSKTIKIYILPKPYTATSRADWSRAMADKSTGCENDVVMAQFVFLFAHVVSWQVSTKMDVNNNNNSNNNHHHHHHHHHNNFINLLKKAFQLNLQCQISKT